MGGVYGGWLVHENRQNVFIESQTTIKHDTEHFDVVGYR